MEKCLYFMESFPFAILIPNASTSTLAYCPLVASRHCVQPAEIPNLYGHLDNLNPILHLLDQRTICAVFPGPNGYVSPHDYVSEQYPTWNYACVEVRGKCALVRNEAEKRVLMIDLLHRFEGYGQDCVDTGTVQFQSLLRHVSFFTLDVESILGRFKFSQEKCERDKRKAISHLRNRISGTLWRTLPVLAGLD